MTGRLQDKVAVVTGASSGIGRSIALRYASEGAQVVCADIRDVAHAQGSITDETSITTHDQITKDGGKAIFVKTDVTDEAAVESLVKKAVEWGGRLDVMCNNAGHALEGLDPHPIWETSLDMFNKTMNLNSTGVFLGTKHAAAQMLKQEPHASGDKGWIINTASILGLVASPMVPAYCASKAACVNITRSAALACGPQRIHVNCICPGYVRSNLTAPILGLLDTVQMIEKLHPFGERFGEPEDVSRIAVFLASDDARWVNGSAMVVDGGFTCQ